MQGKILFLTLRIFSDTGGIEKVSRAAGKALYELGKETGNEVNIFSMYDNPADINRNYFPAACFKGFAENKTKFVFAATGAGRQSSLVVLSHVNLLLAGFLIKLVSPKTKLVLLAHGIEVWGAMSAWQKYMLKQCDQVLAVSRFTRNKIIEVQGMPAVKCNVLNNCLDPYLPAATTGNKDETLMRRYGLSSQDIVLLTLTRLSSREQYKGYDNVLHSLSEIKKSHPGIKYLVIGKYDAAEKQRMDKMIAQLGLQQQVIFAGFIPEEELGAHYSIADMYIMPSKKEGFGIVFIEAMFYGKPVIAGNKDGSVDALDNGKYGLLVDPDNQQEITNAITKMINNASAYIPARDEIMNRFSYKVYKENLRKLVFGEK